MEIFSEPLSRRYRASCCSWASLCNFILVLIAIIIPYLWAFTSESFWLKQSTYREQATLAFTHKVLVELEIVDSTLSNPYSALIWSTEPAVNAVANQLYRPAKILANSNDDNSDGKVDSVNITVDFPLSDDEQVVGVKALAFFNYQLNDRAKITMEGLAVYQGSTSRPASRLFVDGTLDLNQRSLLWTNGGFLTFYEDEPLLDTNGYSSYDEVTPQKILDLYNQRNFTTRFDVPYPAWTVQPPVTIDTTPHFVLEMLVRNIHQTVEYVPNLAEMLKFAWIQYFAMFVIVYVLCYAIKLLVYPNQVFETEVIIDQGAYRGPKQHNF